MTGTTTNNKFTTSMNRRKSRFGDRGQRGGRGRFNQGGPGRGSGGYDKKTKNKNNEENDSFTGNCEDLKNCLFVLDGKQIVNYDDCKDALVLYAQKNCSVAVAKTIEKGKDLSMVYYKQPSSQYLVTPTSSSSSYQQLLTTEQLKMYLKSIQKFEADCYKMYGIIKGQCSKMFLNKMKGLKSWPSAQLQAK